eukprot:gene10803-10880_t
MGETGRSGFSMKFGVSGIDWSSRRVLWLGFAGLTLAIAIVHLTGRPLALTGDEPRYVMYAVSMLRYGRFAMTLAEWQPLYLAATGSVAADLPVGGNNIILMHGVYLPALFAPVGALFGLGGLRFATMLAGIAGLWFLLRICRRVAGPGAALLATAVAGLSVPLLPYLHLFYMETFLFALVAFTWNRLQAVPRGLGFDLVTGLLILFVPFVHMRGAVVAAALFVMLLLDMWRVGRRQRAAGFVAMAGGALVLLIAMNLWIYGVVTGPVNTARPPLPWEWFSVVSMQLFNVRHGLIAFAPVWLLGYAGLIMGSLRGQRISQQGLILAVLAGLTGMGVNPGECWPARFWVLSIPMLALGLCVTWAQSRSWLMRGVAVALIAMTMVNTWLFINVPNMLVENRQTTATYQRAYDKIGGFHPGLMLPVELDDEADTGAARDMALGSALFVLCVCAGMRRRRWVAAVPAALLVLMALDLTRVGVVPKSDYTVSTEAQGFSVRFERPSSAIYVQTGHNWETWFQAPAFPRVTLQTTGADGRSGRVALDVNQVIAASCAGGVRSVAVTSDSFDFAPALAAKIAVYRSRSVIREMLLRWRKTC